MTQPPISFAEKASASKSGAGGYPIQISAKDLDANFSYATLEISDTSPQGNQQPFSVDEFTGPGGHTQRRLIFQPAAPSKDAVFAVVGGALAWLQVPDSPDKQNLTGSSGQLEWAAAIQDGIQDGTVNNELLRWNAPNETWEPFGRGATDGQLLVAQSGGWVPFNAPPSSGTHVLGAVDGALQWISTEEC